MLGFRIPKKKPGTLAEQISQPANANPDAVGTGKGPPPYLLVFPADKSIGA